MIRLTEIQRNVLFAAADRDNGSIYPLPVNLKGAAITRTIHALLRNGLIAESPGNASIEYRRMPLAITAEGRNVIAVDPNEIGLEIPEPLGKLTVAQIAQAISTITGKTVGVKSFNYKAKALQRLTDIMIERDVDVGAVLQAAGIEALTAAGKPVAGIGPVEPTAPPKPIRPPRRTKQQVLIDLLQRDGGASIEQMTKATGWLPHTVRGVISNVLRKKLGLTVTMQRTERGERIYRITDNR